MQLFMPLQATVPAVGDRVLVTGGTGFIGRHTLVPLLDAGYEVHLVTRDEPSPPPEVRVLRADLLIPGVPEAVVARVAPSHLLHMAWFVAPGQVWNSFENVRWVEASLALLRGFARAGGSRAVVVGTCSEYTPTDEPCVEYETSTQPSTLYGISKDSLRRMAEVVAREAGLSLAWARVFMAYGPHEHPARLVASVTRNLLLGQPAPCSHGRQVRDFLHTSNIGAALVSLLGTTVTGPVNVASGRSVTVGEIVQHIGRRLERPELLGFGTDLSGLPPTLIDVGSVDLFRDEDVAFASTIWKSGGDAELHVWPGGYHGFELIAPGAALSADAYEARRRWLARTLLRGRSCR